MSWFLFHPPLFPTESHTHVAPSTFTKILFDATTTPSFVHQPATCVAKKTAGWGVFVFFFWGGGWRLVHSLDFCLLKQKSNQERLVVADKSLAILCALFGMVKWPFQGVQWPPTRGWKGHFESPGLGFFCGDCSILWTFLLDKFL